MIRCYVVIIFQQFSFLHAANILNISNSCSQMKCVFWFSWNEWTPHVYNISIKTSNFPPDTSLALSFSDTLSYKKIMLCSVDAENNHPVILYDSWATIARYREAVFAGQVTVYNNSLTCSFSMYKWQLPQTRLNVGVFSVHVVARQNGTSLEPLNYFELGRDVEFRKNDRYFIRSKNNDTKFILFHGMCMLLAYATVFTLSLFLSRYMKRISCSEKWQRCYVGLVVLSIVIQGIGLICLLGSSEKIDMAPLQFHRFSGIFGTILLGFHFMIIFLKPHMKESRLKGPVSHLSIILSMSIFLLSFSSSFTGLAQLTGLPRGTIIYIACYMFLIIVVGFAFSEILYIYFPVKLEGYFKILKVSFVVISVFICLFGISLPIILFVM